MRTMAATLVAALLGIATTSALAQVEVTSPWARATVQGQKTSSAYMQLKSSEESFFVGAESPAAATVELHEMRMDGNVMRMRAVPKLDLPVGKAVELKPGGYHLMLIDLRQPLRKGDIIPITLKIEGRDKIQKTVELKAEVRESGAATKQRRH